LAGWLAGLRVGRRLTVLWRWRASGKGLGGPVTGIRRVRARPWRWLTGITQGKGDSTPAGQERNGQRFGWAGRPQHWVLAQLNTTADRRLLLLLPSGRNGLENTPTRAQRESSSLPLRLSCTAPSSFSCPSVVRSRGGRRRTGSAASRTLPRLFPTSSTRGVRWERHNVSRQDSCRVHCPASVASADICQSALVASAGDATLPKAA
jgi:hypothetical protein